MSNAQYMADAIGKELVGTTIKGSLITPDGESFGFQVVRKAPGRGNYDVIDVWVDCDPEGNGPGWLNIEVKS